MRCITLTTDYGTSDYYAATLKGRILSYGKDVQIIDISHNIDHFDIVQASFFLKNTMDYFPEKSIHIVAVNCNYKKSAKFIIFEKNGHFFIGPDNGVFSLIFDNFDAFDIYQIVLDDDKPKDTNSIYSHAVGYLTHGLPLEEIGPKLMEINKKIIIQPVITSDQIRASVIHIDHYENVIINLQKEEFERVRKKRNFQLYFKPNEPIIQISHNYSDVAIGEPVALFNDSGYLEIALNLEKAASMLNLNKGDMIQINFI